MSEVGTEIHGTCAAGYEPVREAFAENFAERDEIGASVAVAVGGDTVVNLWAGWADPGRTREWQEDTLTNVWSTTKAIRQCRRRPGSGTICQLRGRWSSMRSR